MNNLQRLCSLTLLVFLSLHSGSGINFATGDDALDPITVDPANIYVDNFEGWGTALAWGGVVVGGWPDEYRNDIADMLFSSTDGIGLNVVRYNIGGGPNPRSGFCGRMRLGADVPGFQPGPGVWDWDADANQRWFLQAAKDRGANLFLAFSDSPPAWMTISGCTNGAGDGGNNLKPNHYQDFADYLATVLNHFRTEWGIEFAALSPMNEPNSDWWKATGRQEGCAFDVPAQIEVINAVARSLTAQGLGDVQLAVADTFAVDETVANWSHYPLETQAHIGVLSTHSYSSSASARATLHAIASQNDKRVWMTEFGAGPGPYDPASMLPALDLAARIVEDMRELQPSAWIVWDGIESDEENRSNNIMWGLITARYRGTRYIYTPTRQYYAYGTFSRFVRPGAQIIGVSDDHTLAAYHPETRQLVLVTYNASDDDREAIYDLGQFATIALATPYRTTVDESLAQLPEITLDNNRLAVIIPARSVTAYVMRD